MLLVDLFHHALPIAVHASGGGVGDITADYTFPVFKLLKKIISWVLGGSVLLVYGALIVGILLIVFKGFGNERARGIATANIGFVIMGTLVLSGITGVWTFIVGLDLGFGAA